MTWGPGGLYSAYWETIVLASDLHHRVEALFDRAIRRVLLERIDGELTVTEVDFDGAEDSEPQRQAALSLPRVRKRGSE